MWNGNAVSRVAVLAISILSIAGCDSGTAPRQTESGYQLDGKRNRVWVLTRDGVVVRDASSRQGVSLALPGWTWAGAPYGCTPVLAIGPKGEAVVTSDVVPTLWRIDPDTFAVTLHQPALDADKDKDVGFSALAYSVRHAAYFAASSGSLWKIDAQLRTAQKVASTALQPCLGGNS